MAKEALIAFIQSNIPVSGNALTTIIDHFEERTIKKNEFFLQEGKVSNDYFFLETGCMRAYTHDLHGNQVTTYFYTKYKYVFEVSSLFMRTVSTETIQALTDCSGYSITFETLNKLFHSSPEFREFGRMMLVKAFAAFKQRTLDLINKSAEERYLNLMSTDREIFQYAQIKHIASYLGITDTSLSRIRREFTKK
ncbi:Crp/Fnr family transcriptional regulator [Spirosoma lituiforme]